MQLSHHSDFALRILMSLAASKRRMSVEQIAVAYDISRHHLAKVALRLVNEGWVKSTRGRTGGLQLAVPPEEINVGTVISRLENFECFVGCFSGGGGCAISGKCGLQPLLDDALAAFLAQLERYTLADITNANSSIFDGTLENQTIEQ